MGATRKTRITLVKTLVHVVEVEEDKVNDLIRDLNESGEMPDYFGESDWQRLD